MQTQLAGEDPAMDAAVLAIMKKMPVGDAPDTRTNEARDVNEQQHSTDLEESERAEREAQAQETQDGKEPAESEEAAESGADQFIELPAAAEGEEPVKIPVSEAVEAVQKLRQMEGDIATAVIRIETEAQQKQDQITNGLMQTFETVATQAETALRVMAQYFPQQPNPIMLDRNSGYYDPEGYHTAKIHYDGFVQHYRSLEATVKQANDGKWSVQSGTDRQLESREMDRAARYIPEFKDPATRETKKGEILQGLAKYGFTKEDLDEIVDHRAWRALNDLAEATKAKTKAPEVRKHVQEKAPKIVNGRPSQERAPDGTFVSSARKQLKETGSTDAFASLLLKSGALKQFSS